MKKKLIISSFVTLLCLPIFGGCKNDNSSSELGPEAKEQEMLQGMLDDLRKGFSFEGGVDHTRIILDGYYGNPTGEQINIRYDAEFVYEMSDENGYSSYITAKQDDKSEKVVNDIQVFEGNDGYAYFLIVLS